MKSLGTLRLRARGDELAFAELAALAIFFSSACAHYRDKLDLQAKTANLEVHMASFRVLELFGKPDAIKGDMCQAMGVNEDALRNARTPLEVLIHAHPVGKPWKCTTWSYVAGRNWGDTLQIKFCSDGGDLFVNNWDWW